MVADVECLKQTPKLPPENQSSTSRAEHGGVVTQKLRPLPLEKEVEKSCNEAFIGL